MTRPKCVGNKRTHESQGPPSDTFQNSKLQDDSFHNDAASSYLSPNKRDKLEGKNNIDKQQRYVFVLAWTSYLFWVLVSWDSLLFEVSPTVKEASSHNGPPFENAKQKWQDQRAAGQPRCRGVSTWRKHFCWGYSCKPCWKDRAVLVCWDSTSRDSWAGESTGRPVYPRSALSFASPTGATVAWQPACGLDPSIHPDTWNIIKIDTTVSRYSPDHKWYCILPQERQPPGSL